MRNRVPTLSRAQAESLGYGDVLIVNEVPRLILEGPRDKRQMKSTALYFTFPIHRRSWTGRATTTRLYNDLKWTAYVPRKKFDLDVMSEAEQESLRDIGFDPIAEMRREIRHEEEFRARIAKSKYTSLDGTISRAFRAMKVCLRRNLRG